MGLWCNPAAQQAPVTVFSFLYKKRENRFVREKKLVIINHIFSREYSIGAQSFARNNDE